MCQENNPDAAYMFAHTCFDLHGRESTELGVFFS